MQEKKPSSGKKYKRLISGFSLIYNSYMTGLSRIEHTLTSPIRQFIQSRYSHDQIRITAFILSLITCVLDASVVTFSLFNSDFITHLGYTQVDINVISGSMLIGLYLTLPLLGYLADAHGSVMLAIIGLSLTPGYLISLWVYNNHMSHWWMSLGFGLIGMGTSSSYFCSLLTCAKVFPDRKSLGISLPVTFYGLSSLILTWVLHLPIFSNKERGGISLEKVFYGLAVMYFIVGLINWVSSIVVSIEKEIVFERLLDEERQIYGSVPDDDHLVDDQTHDEKFKLFLKDPVMKLGLVALFLLAGPLELYISNLGPISTIIHGDVSTQVGVFSVFSTLTRLSMGVISDQIGSLNGNVNLILCFGVGLAVLGFGAIASGIEVPLSLVSSLLGFPTAQSLLSSRLCVPMCGVWKFSAPPGVFSSQRRLWAQCCLACFLPASTISIVLSQAVFRSRLASSVFCLC